MGTVVALVTGEAERGERKGLRSGAPALPETGDADELFGAVFAQAPVPMAAISPEAMLVRVNAAAADLVGYSEAELTGASFALITHPDSVAGALEALGGLVSQRLAHVRIEMKLVHKDGHTFDVEVFAWAVYEPTGELKYFVGLAHDLTERHKLEEEVRHRAAHDHLTELPNRQWFIERLGQALARARRDRSTLAVFFVDLDGFKPVNDRLGHHSGDEVLFAAAGRISRVIRPDDTLARYGGDEFTILCEHLPSSTEAEEIARRVLAAFDRPFITSGGAASLTSSVGIVLVTGGRSSPAAVLEAADAAMYEGKRAGKATYRMVRLDPTRSSPK